MNATDLTAKRTSMNNQKIDFRNLELIFLLVQSIEVSIRKKQVASGSNGPLRRIMEKIPSRRTFLAALAASGIVVVCGGCGSQSTSQSNSINPPIPSPPSNPSGARVPLTIDLSHANLPAGTPVYAYIVGGLITAPAPAAVPIANYYLDATGKVNSLSMNDNLEKAGTFPDSNKLSGSDAAKIAQTYPSDWADYSIPLSLTKPTVIDLGNINTTNIPHLGTGTNAFSARIYISVGIPKLPFTVLAASSNGPNPYTGPALQVGTPGALCLYDWFEFSIDSNGILNGNTTQVDQFGFPLIIDVTPGGTPQGALNLSRSAVMSKIANLAAPLTAILPVPVTAPSAYPAGTGYLRAFSPDHISSAGGANTQFDSYFDQTIADWYANMAAQPLVVTDTKTGTYSGMNVGGNLIFIQGNYANAKDWNTANSSSPSQINFGAITTAQIWQCKGPLASGSAEQLNIGKQILAAFNRGVMSYALNDGTCPDAASFYPAGTPSNLWANSFHQWNSNHLAYGFAYDDVCSQNPSIQSSATLQSLSITLGAMF